MSSDAPSDETTGSIRRRHRMINRLGQLLDGRWKTAVALIAAAGASAYISLHEGSVKVNRSSARNFTQSEPGRPVSWRGTTWQLTQIAEVPRHARRDQWTHKVIPTPAGTRLMEATFTVRPDSVRSARRITGCEVFLRDSSGRRWKAGALIEYTLTGTPQHESCLDSHGKHLKPHRRATVTQRFLVPDRFRIRRSSVDVQVSQAFPHAVRLRGER